MSDKNRRFATHPRTLREALTIILDRARKGKICEGGFAANGMTDPVFACFTVRQRNDVTNRIESGEETIERLVSIIGKDNLKAMTGMTVLQAKKLTDFSDCNAMCNSEKFKERLKDILNKGRGVINNTRFILEAA